jgi:hypothetical protein
MNKLLTFELYKSTYMGAATKLEPKHKKRAEELRKHAAEKGISAFTQKEGYDRIYPHPFVFENYRGLEMMENAKGKFFITDYKYGHSSYSRGYTGIDVIMKSDYGNKITVEFVVGPDKFTKLDLEFEGGYTNRNFLFNNRKDAIEYRKFILEVVEDEIPEAEFDFNQETMPINNLYTTE